MAAGLLGLGVARVPAAPLSDVAELRRLADRWTALKRETAAESANLLRDRARRGRERSLLLLERKALEEEIAELRSRAAERESELERAAAERDRLAAAYERRRAAVETAAAALSSWKERLSPPLAASLDPHWERLERGRREGDLSGRLETVLALFSGFDRLLGEARAVEEVVAPPGESRRLVRAVYLGLARAFAVSPGDGSGWVGRPGEDGWAWTRDDRVVPAVRTALRVLEGEAPPAYAVFPLDVGPAGSGEVR